MDRRSTIAAILGRQTKNENNERSEALAPPSTTGLNPYTGPWTDELAAHLLRRSTFGPKYSEIKAFSAQGLEDSIDQLFVHLDLPSPPLNYRFPNDPNVPLGETWIDADYVQGAGQGNQRRVCLRAWRFDLITQANMNIREKMTLFWQNHFAISMDVVTDAKYIYRYNMKLREHCLGNFKSLIKMITIDPSMLRFLNGHESTGASPNENYARELLELYTIGKGPAVGPGDYTHYTEDDIKEMARVLTGWRARGHGTQNGTPIEAVYINNRHDTGTKQLSHRFNNVTIENAGDQEYSNLIDIIFEQDEVARHICRKFYRWFVYYKIDETIEQEIIAPMAEILLENDYEVQPVIEALLKSEHFYSIYSQGPMIKNPIDFIAGGYRQFDISSLLPANANFQVEFSLWSIFVSVEEESAMRYHHPPSVAGWPAYYLEPIFYQAWINSATLPILMNQTDNLVFNGFILGDVILKADVLKFVAELENNLDPLQMIDEIALVLFPQGITENQRNFLKEILIPGLPDYEWGIEYSEYLADPSNEELRSSVEKKLRNLFKAMLNMPEYFLS